MGGGVAEGGGEAGGEPRVFVADKFHQGKLGEIPWHRVGEMTNFRMANGE